MCRGPDARRFRRELLTPRTSEEVLNGLWLRVAGIFCKHSGRARYARFLNVHFCRSFRPYGGRDGLEMLVAARTERAERLLKAVP